MTRLKRITNKIFGNTASTTGSPDTGAEIGQFGSAKAGTYNATADVETIQALPAYEQGWIGAVIPDQQYPTLPEMTGVNKVLSYQTGYLMQEGIPEWDSGTTYYKNSIVKYAKVTTTQTTTASIGASTGITSASVNKNTFISQISVDGNYTFTYNGTSWLYNDIAIDLNIYGITYTGTPAENDTITVTLTTTTSIGDLALYKSLTDDNTGNNPIAENSIHWEEISLGGGSGLEICDIGMALYVDETKGLRRYLNGQIVDINTNTQAFLNRLQQITTLHPSLLCTENEWQTAKTSSAFGQVGKFVFNYSGNEIVSVRLPRVVNVQGLFDLQKLGMTVGAGLPNITGSCGSMINVSLDPSGAFSIKSRTYNTHDGGPGNGFIVNFDASNSNPIYKNGSTVQQEAIQYPYFIQIATGSETENNIINEIELNNPYSLFDSKYSDHELNNLSWLKSEGQWNAKSVYTDTYDKLLKVYNGTETVEGLSVKLSTEAYTDYDFVLNTADETFRLPLLDGSEDLVSDRYKDLEILASGATYTAPANGWLILAKQANGTNQYVQLNATVADLQSKNMFLVGDEVYNNGSLAYCHIPMKKGQSTKIYYNAGGTVYAFRFVYAQGNGSLYFYVGETVQNANLINAGRIGEQVANCITRNDCKAYVTETYLNGTSWYRIYSDGWCEQGGRITSSKTDTNIQITLLKNFSNTNYYVNLTSNSTINTFNQAQPNWVNSRAVNSFSAHIDAYVPNETDWMACGY